MSKIQDLTPQVANRDSIIAGRPAPQQTGQEAGPVVTRDDLPRARVVAPRKPSLEELRVAERKIQSAIAVSFPLASIRYTRLTSIIFDPFFRRKNIT
jgi:hypothetical protein